MLIFYFRLCALKPNRSGSRTIAYSIFLQQPHHLESIQQTNLAMIGPVGLYQISFRSTDPVWPSNKLKRYKTLC